MKWFAVGLTVGIVLLALLWYKHSTCEECQRKWAEGLEKFRNWVSRAKLDGSLEVQHGAES